MNADLLTLMSLLAFAVAITGCASMLVDRKLEGALEIVASVVLVVAALLVGR